MNEMTFREAGRETEQREPADTARIIQAMSKIYTSAYYIDLKTGLFTELSSLDVVKAEIGTEGDAQDRLNYFCRNMMVPAFTQEMLEFTNLTTLEERLGDGRIISRQYLSTVELGPEQGGEPYWTQCSFIECDRDSDGHLHHVLFTTQTIHDAKIKELEARRKEREANQELTALLESERRHTAIIGSLSSIFYGLYYVDLVKNAVQEVICLDSAHHIYRDGGDARQFLRRLTELLATPEHLPSLALFLDYDTMGARLGSSRIITREFMARSGGWTRCSIIPVERGNSGLNRSVIVGMRQVTAERERQETQNNLILALSMAYDNVYSVNLDTDAVTCYRMSSAMLKRYGRRFAEGSYTRNMEEYLQNEVHPDDRQLFGIIATAQRLEELTKERQSYSFQFRVRRDGRVQYFQCHVARPSRERREIAVAFKNVDEEKRQELAQQRMLQDALTKVEKANSALQEEMTIVDALSREYHSLFKIDAEKGTISLYRTDGIGMDRGI